MWMKKNIKFPSTRAWKIWNSHCHERAVRLFCAKGGWQRAAVGIMCAKIRAKEWTKYTVLCVAVLSRQKKTKILSSWEISEWCQPNLCFNFHRQQARVFYFCIIYKYCRETRSRQRTRPTPVCWGAAEAWMKNVCGGMESWSIEWHNFNQIFLPLAPNNAMKTFFFYSCRHGAMTERLAVSRWWREIMGKSEPHARMMVDDIRG